jgi:hypothetical protein
MVAAQPTPPDVLFPVPSKLAVLKQIFTLILLCRKIVNTWPSLAANTLPASYLESNDWMLLINSNAS